MARPVIDRETRPLGSAYVCTIRLARVRAGINEDASTRLRQIVSGQLALSDRMVKLAGSLTAARSCEIDGDLALMRVYLGHLVSEALAILACYE